MFLQMLSEYFDANLNQILYVKAGPTHEIQS